jgi:hypothetical protein
VWGFASEEKRRSPIRFAGGGDAVLAGVSEKLLGLFLLFWVASARKSASVSGHFVKIAEGEGDFFPSERESVVIRLLGVEGENFGESLRASYLFVLIAGIAIL